MHFIPTEYTAEQGKYKYTILAVNNNWIATRQLLNEGMCVPIEYLAEHFWTEYIVENAPTLFTSVKVAQRYVAEAG